MSQTVSEGDSALFTFFPVGALTFQWRFNGADFPGETNAMLLLDNVTTNLSGLYSVSVTDGNGASAISSNATLLVTQNAVPPVLSFNPPSTTNDHIRLYLSGELGRGYRVEFSTNLSAWSDAYPVLVPQDCVPRNGGKVFQNTNGVLPLSFQLISSGGYFRAYPYQVSSEGCHKNLKRLAYAKWHHAIAAKRGVGDAVSTLDLLNGTYFKNNQWPVCPNSGTYTLGVVGVTPVCSFPGHEFLDIETYIGP